MPTTRLNRWRRYTVGAAAAGPSAPTWGRPTGTWGATPMRRRPAPRTLADMLETAEELAAATPKERDRVVDFVRVAAVAVVVVGHWLMAAVTWDDAGVHGRNILSVAPWAQWLTWPFQVMPLVFVAGGAANAASWASARRSGTPYAAWLQGRLRRLVLPTAALVGVWAAGLAIAHRAGADPEVLDAAGRLVGMPLWFLAVYVPVVALTPWSVAAHERWGLRATAALVALAAVADLAGGPLAWSSFAWVWLFAHELGFWWRDRRIDRAGAVALGGIVGLVLLTTVGGYPRSMIGLPGERSNMTPPSLAMVALAVTHFGLLSLARPRLERWLLRPRVWRQVIVANAVVMTTYLWHMTALALGVLGLMATGFFPQPDPASANWWAWRPVWIVALVALTLPLVLLWAPAETRRARRARTPSAPTALAATLGLTVTLAYLALEGVPVG